MDIPIKSFLSRRWALNRNRKLEREQGQGQELETSESIPSPPLPRIGNAYSYLNVPVERER